MKRVGKSREKYSKDEKVEIASLQKMRVSQKEKRRKAFGVNIVSSKCQKSRTAEEKV